MAMGRRRTGRAVNTGAAGRRCPPCSPVFSVSCSSSPRAGPRWRRERDGSGRGAGSVIPNGFRPKHRWGRSAERLAALKGRSGGRCASGWNRGRRRTRSSSPVVVLGGPEDGDTRRRRGERSRLQDAWPRHGMYIIAQEIHVMPSGRAWVVRDENGSPLGRLREAGWEWAEGPDPRCSRRRRREGARGDGRKGQMIPPIRGKEAAMIFRKWKALLAVVAVSTFFLAVSPARAGWETGAKAGFDTKPEPIHRRRRRKRVPFGLRQLLEGPRCRNPTGLDDGVHRSGSRLPFPFRSRLRGGDALSGVAYILRPGWTAALTPFLPGKAVRDSEQSAWAFGGRVDFSRNS